MRIVTDWGQIQSPLEKVGHPDMTTWIQMSAPPLRVARRGLEIWRLLEFECLIVFIIVRGPII